MMASSCSAGAAATLLLLFAAAVGSELGPAAVHRGRHGSEFGRAAERRGRNGKPFDPFNDGHLEEPQLDDDYIHDSHDGLEDWMNEQYTTTTTVTTTTTTTTTTHKKAQHMKVHKKGACVTKKTPLDQVWMAGLAPSKLAKEGTECVFGADARDEGGHCIQQHGKYGEYGWCFTAHDGSAWGSCSAGCPMFGQEKKLSTRIKEMEAKLEDTRKKLIPELAKATAKADCMDCKAHSSLLGAAAKVDCTIQCRVPAHASMDHKKRPATKEANKTMKAAALVQQDRPIDVAERSARVLDSRIAELQAKLSGTKEWVSFLMVAAARS